jgi:hypothetical protein
MASNTNRKNAKNVRSKRTHRCDVRSSHEKEIEKLKKDIEKLKDATRDIKFANGNGAH